MASQTDEILLSLKVVADTKAFTNSLKGLMAEKKALEKIDFNLITKEQQQAVLSRIGNLQGAIEDLKIATKSMDMGDVFQNIAQVGSLASGAIGGITAAMGALGIESKATENIEKKLMMTIQLTMALQQLADAKRLKGMIAMRTEQLQNLLTFQKVEKAQEAGVVTTNLLTRAQLAWNAAIRANPAGVLLSIIAALVVAMGALYLVFNKSEKSVKEYEKAIDGTVIKDEKLREAHNESIKTLRNLSIEYRVATGALTEYGAEVERVNNEIADSFYDLKIQLSKDFEEIDKNKNSFFGGLMEGLSEIPRAIAAVLNGETYISENELKTIAAQDKYNRAVEDKTKEGQEKLKTLQAKHEAEVKQKVIDFRISRLKETLSILNAEYQAIVASNEKILGYYRSIFQKEKELKTRGLTPEQKEIQGVNDYYEGIKTDIDEINRQLENEKKNRDEISIRISEQEKLLKRYSGAQNSIGVQIGKSKKVLEDQMVVNTQTLTSQRELLDTMDKENKKYTEIGGKTVTRKELVDEMSRIMKEQVTLYQQIGDLDIQGLQASNEKAALEKQISDNIKEQKKSKEEVARLEKLQAETRAKTATTTDAELEERAAREREAIRQKYARERKMAIKTDELEIVKLQIAGQQEIINNEKLQNPERRRAIQERNRLLNEALKIETNLSNLRIAAYQASIDELKTKEQTAAVLEEILVLQGKITLEQMKLKSTSQDIKKAKKEEPLLDFNKPFSEQANYILELVADLGSRINEVLGASMDLWIQQTQIKTELAIENINKMLEQEKENLKRMNDEKLISDKQYQDKVAALEKQAKAEESRLKREQFNREKQANIINAIMNGAVAVVSSLKAGFPLGVVFAAITAALVATQVALIAKQPTPQYATGGYILGPSHSSGGVTANMEGGEYVINKNVAQRPGMGDFLNKVNSGQVNNTTTTQGINRDDLSIIVSEVVKGTTAVPVYVTETNITKTQRKVSTIETRSSW